MFKSVLTTVFLLCSLSIACKETDTDPLGIEKTISPAGGEIVLKGYAKAIIRAGTFKQNTRIKLEVASSKKAQEAYHTSITHWDAPQRSNYEINFNKGKSISHKPITLEIDVPKQFQKIEKDHYLAILTRSLEESKLSRIDSFSRNKKDLRDTNNKLYIEIDTFVDHTTPNNDIVSQIIILKAKIDTFYKPNFKKK